MTGRRLVHRFFRTTGPATPAEVTEALWNDNVTPQTYVEPEEKYRQAILEQYKLCVEMADRVSARRSLANSFFLTLNGVALTLLGVFWKDRPQANPLWLLFPVLLLSALCLAWFWLIRSYRQLNAGKYVVIAALEGRLPASPYWQGEWKALGEGRDESVYWPLTHVEKWVPVVFLLAYWVGFATALLA